MTVDLPADAGDRLTAYADLVRRWAPRLDLVSPRDLARFEERHIADALRALPVLDSLGPGPAVDIGSGGGVPGVPLAIARPGRQWRLLEPRARRAAFLEEVVRVLELDCEVVAETAEAAARAGRFRSAHAVVTARAVAPPAQTVRVALPFVAPDGLALLWIGKDSQLPPGSVEWGPGLAIIRGDLPRASHPERP